MMPYLSQIGSCIHNWKIRAMSHYCNQNVDSFDVYMVATVGLRTMIEYLLFYHSVIREL